jgi:carboxylesterase
MTDVLPGCEPFSSTSGNHGVLVLHGFTGNPSSMRPLAERISAAGFQVELPRLAGHGTSVEDMMSTSFADWSSDALKAYDDLASRVEKVAVVGLSMGGGLTAFVAEERPDVAALVFINPLVKHPGDEFAQGIKDLIEGGMETFESIGSDIKKEGSKEASYNATPLRQVLSLFDGVKGVESRLGEIKAPALLLSSREDHVVTSDNGDLIEEKLDTVERIWLEDSYHVATLDNDAELVESLTVSFLQKVLS